MKFLTFLALIISLNAYAKQSFQDVLKLSLENDPNLERELKNIKLYDSLKWQQYASFLPAISLTGSQIDEKFEGNSRRDYQRNALNASVDVFAFGRDYYKVREGMEFTDFQKSNYTNQLLTSEKRILDLLFSYISNDRSLEINRRIREIKEQAFKMANVRYKRGRLALQEMQKLQIDLYNVEAELASQEIQRNNIVNQISEYTKIDVLTIAWPWKADIAEKILKTQVLNAKEHPLWVNSKTSYDMASYQKKSSVANFLGDISFSYSKGYNQFDSDLLHDERVALTYTLPLFNSFSDLSTYRDRVAKEYSAKKQLKNTTRSVNVQYEEAKKALEKALQTYRLRNKTLQLSKDIYTNSLDQFKKGRITVNEFSIDQNRLLTTELLANSGERQLHRAIVNYCHSVGKAVVKDCFN
jgi:outer membrane protein TolC